MWNGNFNFSSPAQSLNRFLAALHVGVSVFTFHERQFMLHEHVSSTFFHSFFISFPLQLSSRRIECGFHHWQPFLLPTRACAALHCMHNTANRMQRRARELNGLSEISRTTLLAVVCGSCENIKLYNKKRKKKQPAVFIDGVTTHSCIYAASARSTTKKMLLYIMRKDYYVFLDRADAARCTQQLSGVVKFFTICIYYFLLCNSSFATMSVRFKIKRVREGAAICWPATLNFPFFLRFCQQSTAKKIAELWPILCVVCIEVSAIFSVTPTRHTPKSAKEQRCRESRKLQLLFLSSSVWRCAEEKRKRVRWPKQAQNWKISSLLLSTLACAPSSSSKTLGRRHAHVASETSCVCECLSVCNIPTVYFLRRVGSAKFENQQTVVFRWLEFYNVQSDPSLVCRLSWNAENVNHGSFQLTPVHTLDIIVESWYRIRLARSRRMRFKLKIGW